VERAALESTNRTLAPILAPLFVASTTSP